MHRTQRPPRARQLTLRALALWVHRYVGLLTAVFLVVAGLTGSLLAFYHELDHALNPQLFRISESRAGGPLLDPFEQRDALQAQLPPALTSLSIDLQAPEHGRTSSFYASARSGGEHELDDEFFVDPRSGKVIGSRRWGDLSRGLHNLMPFVYRLHYSLALGEVGTFAFGVIALLWTVDCFVGGYLTFPPPRRREGRRGARVWLAGWAPAWLLRGGQLFSWIFTWHRASGLWVWAMLLVFAWSAVGLNLREVYSPVMRTVFGMEAKGYERLRQHEPPRLTPELTFREATDRGRTLMAEQARARGFQILSERRIAYNPEVGAFRYQVDSSLDVADRYASTTVWLDGDTGELLALDAPTGSDAGQTVTTWLYQLHFGSVKVLGFPYRIFVCVLGLLIAVLSVTGVWIWWVKREKRVARRARRPAHSTSPPEALLSTPMNVTSGSVQMRTEPPSPQ